MSRIKKFPFQGVRRARGAFDFCGSCLTFLEVDKSERFNGRRLLCSLSLALDSVVATVEDCGSPLPQRLSYYEEYVVVGLVERMEPERGDHAPVSSVEDLAKTSKDADGSSEGAQVVKFLTEIVGGFKLGEEEDGKKAVESNGTSDNDVRLYCVVHMGDTEIHKTKGGEGGRNPVWTVSTRSTFLIETTPEELAHESLDISVWSKQKDPFNLTVLAKRFWGKISLSLSDIILSHCDEQRVEIDITRKDGLPSHGTLTLRFRLATASDERFLGLLNKSPELLKQHSERHLEATSEDSKKTSAVLVTEEDEAQMASETFMNAISGAFKSRRYYDKDVGRHKVLVKPGSDPARKEETAYLTKEQLLAETNAPSHRWIEAGSGKLGKLYLEVLSCHDLPNVDVGGKLFGAGLMVIMRVSVKLTFCF